MRVSHSSIQEWVKCRHRYHLKHERRLRPIELGRAPNVGSAVHEGIAYALVGLSVEEGVAAWRAKAQTKIPVQFEEFEPETRTMLDGYQQDAIIIAKRGLATLGNRYETVQIEGRPAVELKLEVPIDEMDVPPDGVFVGVIDWLARDTTDGKILLWDHKVRKSLATPESEEVDTQKVSYMALLWMKYRLLTHGTASFQMLSKLPRVPNVNKNGSISRTAITTDWETYSRTVVANGGNPNDYLDMKAKLDFVTWDRLTVNYRSTREIQSVWDEVTIPLVREMANPDIPRTRSMTPMNCMPSMCPYRQLCMAELKGYDVDYMLQFQYKVVSDEDTLTSDSGMDESLDFEE